MVIWYSCMRIQYKENPAIQDYYQLILLFLLSLTKMDLFHWDEVDG